MTKKKDEQTDVLTLKKCVKPQWQIEEEFEQELIAMFNIDTETKKKDEQTDVLTPAQRRWVNALRSGDFKQGKERLTYRGKDCCLGVACKITDLKLKKGWKKQKTLQLEALPIQYELRLRDKAGKFSLHLIEDSSLLETLREKTSSSFWPDLTFINDAGTVTFEDIANFIEANYKAVFIQPGERY